MDNSGLRIFGFPVKVQLFFFLTMAFIARAVGDTREQIGVGLVAGLSILVHELGHALAYRSFGSRRIAITLTGFGGLTSCSDAGHLGPGRRALVSLAGPGIELVLLALPAYVAFQVLDPAEGLLRTVLFYTIWLNVLWAVFNLVPVMELDGGHIVQHVAHLVTGRDQTRPVRVWSIGVGLAIAVFAYMNGYTFVAIIMGFMVFSNVSALRRPRPPAAPRRPLEMDLDYRNKPR